MSLGEAKLESNLQFQTLDIWAKSLNNAGTFMAQTHVDPKVVFICATETAMGDSDKYLVPSEPFSMCSSFDNTSTWRAFVDREADALRS